MENSEPQKFELAKKMFIAGLNSLMEGQLDNAEKHFISSLELLPNRISTINNLIAVYLQQKKLFEAEQWINRAIEIDSKNFESQCQLVNLLQLKKKWKESLDTLNSTEIINHDNELFYSLKASALWELGDEIAAIDLWKKIEHDEIETNDSEINSLATQFNNGIDSSQWATLNSMLKDLLIKNPSNQLLLQLLGILKFEQKDYDKAILIFKRLMELEQNSISYNISIAQIYITVRDWRQAIKHLELACSDNEIFDVDHHLLLANSLFHIFEYEQALLVYSSITERFKNNVDAIYGRAVCLEKLRHFDESLKYYSKVLEIEPRHLQSLNNKASVLQKIGMYREANEIYIDAWSISSGDIELACNLSLSYSLTGSYDKAITILDEILKKNADSGRAWECKGMIQNAQKKYRDAILSLSKARDWGEIKDGTLGLLLSAKLSVADWKEIDQLINTIKTDIKSNVMSMQPFSFLGVTDDLLLQNKCVNLHNDRLPIYKSEFSITRRSLNDRIKLAFVSPDFKSHPVSYLTCEFIECIDRSKFKVYGVSIGKLDNSIYSKRMVNSFDEFVDLNEISDSKSLEILRDFHLDVAVDLAGHTEGSRPALFINRIASIQVNLIGFPGPMGHNYCDYIVADDYVIPEDLRSYYSEKVIYLPQCFQPNDSKRHRPLKGSSRRRLNLPDDAFIYCAFNNSKKILPTQFDLWIEIIKRTPNSILWLTGLDDQSLYDLQLLFQNNGLAPNRLHISERTSVEEYLANLALADLFLDTLPFNAGTTCSDALWMGVPVLTMSGQAFASRMAGSLLRAMNMTEFIASSQQDYLEKAVYFAMNPKIFSVIKNQLLNSVQNSYLFKGSSYAHHFCEAIKQCVERHTLGLPSEHIDLRSFL